jgi:hypothetical protein
LSRFGAAAFRLLAEIFERAGIQALLAQRFQTSSTPLRRKFGIDPMLSNLSILIATLATVAILIFPTIHLTIVALNFVAHFFVLGLQLVVSRFANEPTVVSDSTENKIFVSAALILALTDFILGPIAAAAIFVRRLAIFWVWSQTRHTFLITARLSEAVPETVEVLEIA